MAPYQPVEQISAGFPHIFTIFVVFLVTVFVLVCVNNRGTKASFCSNKLHEEWTETAPDQVTKWAHPPPRKEILSVCDTRQNHKAGKQKLKICIDCVREAERRLAINQGLDAPAPSGMHGQQSASQTPLGNPTTMSTQVQTQQQNSPTEESHQYLWNRNVMVTTSAFKGVTMSYQCHTRPSQHAHKMPTSVVMPPPPPGWFNQPTEHGTMYFGIQQHDDPNKDPEIVKSVTVNKDGTWNVRIFGCILTSDLLHFGPCLNSKTCIDLLQEVHTLKICVGHPSTEYHKLVRNNKIGNKAIQVQQLVMENGVKFTSTIRSTTCTMTTKSTRNRCQECCNIAGILRAHRSLSSDEAIHVDRLSSSSSVKFSSLQPDELLQRCKNLAVAKKNLQRTIKRMEMRMKMAINDEGVDIGSTTTNALGQVMNENEKKVESLQSEASFAKLFWQQQKQAASIGDPRGMRWHPMVIKWCLNLKLQSSRAYNTMKSSGVLKLPCDTTLRSFIHWTKPTSGLTISSLQQLLKEMKIEEREPYQKFVVLVHDEMKIKSDLVYQKSTGRLVGFTDLGNFHNQLRKFENRLQKTTRPEAALANQMFVLMVRGLFWNVTFPIAHFPTSSTTADEIFSICWETIEALEMAGLKVVAITSDGAGTNRKFCAMNDPLSKVPAFQTINPYAEDYARQVFLLSDPPHLVKCVRNSWSHSFAHQRSRMLWNGGNISWKHLEELYYQDLKMNGLYLSKRVKMEHIVLTSFSRMKVSLAAQALSSTVANAMELYQPSATATVEFVRIFDKFFDCLNVRSRREWYVKRKDNLRPYESVDDDRLKWLEEDFIGYLDGWKEKVEARTGLSKTEQNKMQITQETLVGLYRTARGFIGVSKYLLKQPGVQFLLSERFNQDPLESCFGNQRQMRGGNEAPTAARFNELMNAQRLKSSQTLKVFGGNTRQDIGNIEVDDTPLPRKIRKTTKSKLPSTSS